MEKSQLAGHGLAAVVVMGSFGNALIKPDDINSKLDTIIQQNSTMQSSIQLNTYRIGQLEKIDHEEKKSQ